MSSHDEYQRATKQGCDASPQRDEDYQSSYPIPEPPCRPPQYETKPSPEQVPTPEPPRTAPEPEPPKTEPGPFPIPPRPTEPPFVPPPQQDLARTNWWLLCSVILGLLLLLWLVFRPVSSALPGNVSVDFTPISNQLDEIKVAIGKIAYQAPKTSLPVDQSKKDKRIASLEKDVSWLKTLLAKERAKQNSAVALIERHYAMAEHAISELFRAPWRAGEGSRTLCFSTGTDITKCYSRDNEGTRKTILH